ncbi:uncharacterized protein EDB91DRAFT_1050628 [Suillus paluster]|uniref:uncharacterized protein n=1 Tax=Suillus paluster TaxID=48578 RepID=UPI001B85E9EA|nr:uncharacterized protein EDB91DRAFT_1050628 [Suillus paluster]KAG1744662.1 hypothetical protein EDB91DRAFT_1050628 [Suillus paluster]
MYISGTGHTEGKGCKHIFSASNELARSTRHANHFHHHQAIEEHFAFWDANKYATLKALKSVWLLMAELETIKAELCISDDDFPGFFDQECIYLDSLKQPAPQDWLSICYVEVLDKIAEWRAEWDFACESGNNALTGVDAGSLEQMNDTLKQACICIDSSYTKLQHAERLVTRCECVLSVDERWVIGGKEYNHFKEEATLGKYCAALDKLEHSVIMRLFELLKLSLLGTSLSVPLLVGACTMTD